MTTLRTQILACPHCQERMYTIGVMSYTIMNSEVYSDGKVVSNPPIPAEKNILICNTCNKAFWKDDALLDDDNSENINELSEANTPSDLFPYFEPDYELKHINYYSDLLESGFANTKIREVYLRNKLWWLLNDTIRYKNKSKIKDSKNIFDNNLKRLIEIFEPKNEEEELLLIEMYRELGEFDKASYLLKSLKGINNNGAFIQIQKAVNKKKSSLFKLKKNQII